MLLNAHSRKEYIMLFHNAFEAIITPILVVVVSCALSMLWGLQEGATLMLLVAIPLLLSWTIYVIVDTRRKKESVLPRGEYTMPSRKAVRAIIAVGVVCVLLAVALLGVVEMIGAVILLVVIIVAILAIYALPLLIMYFIIRMGVRDGNLDAQCKREGE